MIRSSHRLRWAYVACLSSTAALTVGSQLLLGHMTRSLATDSVLVNEAGRQRALCQRIVAKSAGLVFSYERGLVARASEYETELTQTLESITGSHAVLRGDVASDRVVPFQTDRAHGLIAELDPVLAQLEEAVTTLLVASRTVQNDESSFDSMYRAADDAAALADTFLPIMNDLVSEYERESRSRVAGLQHAELVIALLTIGVLFIQTLAVFEPAARSIRRSQTRAIALQRAAEAASAAKTDFLANMSHEIRTPMTAIVGFADLIATDAARGRPLTEGSVDAIQRNAHHLLTLINDILDVSKIEAGRMTIERVSVDPASEIRQSVALFRDRAQQGGIDLEIEFASTLPETIESDQIRFRQILINLIGNAVKFTESGGRITVRASCDRSAKTLSVEVEDTGIGMSATQLEKIRRFEAFSQADESTTRRFGGTGLGLRISQTLAGLLGGGLRVDSQEGVGSVFTLTAATGELEGVAFVKPAVTQASKPAAIDAGEPGRPLAGVRVLVAEDGPDNQRLFRVVLERAGAEVLLVDDGAKAVEEVLRGSFSPRVIFMDMQMPVLDGYAAAGRLRAEGVETPIVALTAHTLAGDEEKCLSAGCDGYQTKPINPKALIDEAARWAQHGRISRAAA